MGRAIDLYRTSIIGNLEEKDYISGRIGEETRCLRHWISQMKL